MQAESGGCIYKLIFSFGLRKIMVLGSKGCFRADGFARGVLVRRKCWHGDVWYHRPEDYLEWKV